MSIKLSDLTAEQRKALLDKVKKNKEKKNKTREKAEQKERTWAKRHMEEAVPVIKQAPITDQVPVKIDSRTTVMVRRDKCVQLEDGTWVKK